MTTSCRSDIMEETSQRFASGPDGLIYLANAIDMKLEKIEASMTEARKAQLENQLAVLTATFQEEYAAFLAATEAKTQPAS